MARNQTSSHTILVSRYELLFGILAPDSLYAGPRVVAIYICKGIQKNGGPRFEILNRLLDLKLFRASLQAVPCLRPRRMTAPLVRGFVTVRQTRLGH